MNLVLNKWVVSVHTAELFTDCDVQRMKDKNGLQFTV